MSSKSTRLTLVASLLVFFTLSALAEMPGESLMRERKTVPAVYTNAISDGAWEIKQSVFSCSLEHHLPYYGIAQFRTRAGERSAFILREMSSRFEPGEAILSAALPTWQHATRVANRTAAMDEILGSAPAKRGNTPMWLDSDWAELLLLKLYEGKEIEISQKAWYQKSRAERTSLVVTPIGFRPAYEKYLACLGSLLPANFDQMKRSAIYFPAGEVDEIPPAEARKLDRILQITKHDSRVKAFFVDGHTDSEGDRAENLELSRVRAELVANYLTRRGVPEKWITLRWHGERYPVSANTSTAGKAKNRRVTIRMERVEDIEVLPLSENAE